MVTGDDRSLIAAVATRGLGAVHGIADLTRASLPAP